VSNNNASKISEKNKNEKNKIKQNNSKSPTPKGLLYVHQDPNQNQRNSPTSLKTKTITFNKQTINYANNLLTETQEISTLTGGQTNITKEKDETFNFNPNMDCIEDLHFQFVKFCIKSKKIIKYQESATKTCIDDFNTVIQVDEIDLS
jgi:hypothetical protein